MPLFPYKRIVVIGSTSSGKSTLAKQLADRFNYDFIELDALHWEADWKEASLEDFRARVEAAIQAQAWVVAGNYHVVRDLVWSKAEAVIWLDYSLWRIFWQLTRRTFKRWWTQDCSGAQTANRFWFISNSGHKSLCFIGCSKPIGEESANTQSCWLYLSIGI